MEQQQGFRPYRFTVTNLLYCFKTVSESLDSKIHIHVFYTDFKKVFVKDYYEPLFRKL